MFQRFIAWLKGVWGRVFGFDSVASSLGGDVLVSSKMQQAIDKWWRMFENRPPWVSEEDIPTISLPSAIAGEIARLVTVEAESSLTKKHDLLPGGLIYQLHGADGHFPFVPHPQGIQRPHILIEHRPAQGVFFLTEHHRMGVRVRQHLGFYLLRDEG